MNYISRQIGQIPVVLSVPHGGPEEPAFLPFRRQGNRRADEFTIDLAGEISRAMKVVWGEPYLVAALIRRSKIDFNRPPGEAYEDPVAAKYYREYHGALRECIDSCTENHRNSLLLDIHGRRGAGPGAPRVVLGTANYKSMNPEAVKLLLDLLGSRGCTARHDTGGPYRGGFITREYTDGNTVRGLQLEVSREVRQDQSGRKSFALALAEALWQARENMGL